MTFTALFRALCLLWCKKLETPSYAKPIILEAMSSSTEANITLLLCLFSFGKVGSIRPISFVRILYAIWL